MIALGGCAHITRARTRKHTINIYLDARINENFAFSKQIVDQFFICAAPKTNTNKVHFMAMEYFVGALELEENIH